MADSSEEQAAIKIQRLARGGQGRQRAINILDEVMHQQLDNATKQCQRSSKRSRRSSRVEDIDDDDEHFEGYMARLENNVERAHRSVERSKRREAVEHILDDAEKSDAITVDDLTEQVAMLSKELLETQQKLLSLVDMPYKSVLPAKVEKLDTELAKRQHKVQAMNRKQEKAATPVEGSLGATFGAQTQQTKMAEQTESQNEVADVGASSSNFDALQAIRNKAAKVEKDLERKNKDLRRQTSQLQDELSTRDNTIGKLTDTVQGLKTDLLAAQRKSVEALIQIKTQKDLVKAAKENAVIQLRDAELRHQREKEQAREEGMCSKIEDVTIQSTLKRLQSICAASNKDLAAVQGEMTDWKKKAKTQAKDFNVERERLIQRIDFLSAELEASEKNRKQMLQTPERKQLDDLTEEFEKMTANYKEQLRMKDEEKSDALNLVESLKDRLKDSFEMTAAAGKGAAEQKLLDKVLQLLDSNTSLEEMVGNLRSEMHHVVAQVAEKDIELGQMKQIVESLSNKVDTVAELEGLLDTEKLKNRKLEVEADKYIAKFEDLKDSLKEEQENSMKLLQSSDGASSYGNEAFIQKILQLNEQLKEKMEELDITKTMVESSERETWTAEFKAAQLEGQLEVLKSKSTAEIHKLAANLKSTEADLRSVQRDLDNLADEHTQALNVMKLADGTISEMRGRLREQAVEIGEKEVIAEKAVAEAEQGRRDAREATIRAGKAEGELQRLTESADVAMKKAEEFEMRYLQARELCDDLNLDMTQTKTKMKRTESLMQEKEQKVTMDALMLQELQETVDSTKAELEKMQGDLIAKQEEVVRYQVEIEQLKRDKDRSAEEQAATKGKIASLEAEIEIAEEKATQLEAMKKELAESKAEVDMEVDQLRWDKERSEEGLAQAQEKNSQLKEKVTQLEAMKKELAESKAEVDMEVDQLRRDKERSEEGLAQAQEKNIQLQAAAKELTESKVQLDIEVEQAKREKARCDQAQEEAQKELVTLQKELQKAKEDAANLESQSKRLMSELEAAKSSIAELTNQTEELKVASERGDERQRDAEERLARYSGSRVSTDAEQALVKDIKELRQKFFEAEKQVDSAALDAKKAQQALAEASEKMAVVEAERLTATEAKQMAEEKSAQLQTAINEMKQKMVDKDTQSDDLKAQVQKLQAGAADTSQLRSALDEIQQKIADKDKQNDELLAKVLKIEASSAAGNQEVESLTAAREELKTKLKQVTGEMETLKVQLAEVTKASDDLTLELKALQVKAESGSSKAEALVAEKGALQAKRQLAEEEAQKCRDKVTELEQELDEVKLSQLKGEKASQAESEKLNLEVGKKGAEIKILESRLNEARELVAMVSGGDDAESKLMQKVSAYEGMARRAEAARNQMQKEFDHLTAQVKYYKEVQDKAPTKVHVPKRDLSDKLQTLKERKETNMKLKKLKEDDPDVVTDRPAVHTKEQLRQQYLKKMYKEANTTPIPVKTKVGTVHLSQQAYVRKLTHSQKAEDGTMTIAGSADATAALIGLTKQTDAERFLLKVHSAGGVAPKRKQYEVFTTTFGNDIAAAKTEKIRMIFAKLEISFTVIDLHKAPDRRQVMLQRSGDADTLPQIFIDGLYISGGFEELQSMHDRGELKRNNR